MKPLSDLQDEKYHLLLNSQDIEAVLEYVVQPQSERVTGAIAWVADGEYEEIWLTASSAPYLLKAEYAKAEIL